MRELRSAADAQAYRSEASEHLVDEHSDGAYAVIRIDAFCAAALQRTLEIGYRLLAGGSAAIALVAAAWMMERVFDLQIL